MARAVMATLLSVSLLIGVSPYARAADAAQAADASDRVPPRLSYANGEVSFWRPGAPDWAPAQVNTPLAPGDELYTGHDGNLELQVSGRAFVRAWGDTQVGLANQEPDFLQIKVTTGHMSLDLRGVDPGHSVELDTPHAAFTIERPGYYRIDTTPERTSFITRRGGRATMIAPSGQAAAVSASEEIVLEGAPMPTILSYVAPELDVFDRWNYERTDDLLDALSARYVPAGVYGVDDLDDYGTWRVVPTYGPVWVPDATAAGWVPYSTGKWVWDPYFGWTWIDIAPWGWAPYHYGRWVFVDGFWAWAPGPIVVRPVYAPALVAFFRAPGVRAEISVGGPFVSWVALGWGEPVVPWWGRPGFAGRPSWAGWGGPRVVNNVVVKQTTVVNVSTITVYRNTSVHDAVVAVPHEQFGRRPVHEARLTREIDARQLQPVRGAVDVKPRAESFVARSGTAARPPDSALSRRVVATRPPVRRAVAPAPADRPASTPSIAPPRVVAPSRSAPAQAAPVPRRPPFGESDVERPRPSHPSRVGSTPRPQVAPAPVAPRPSERAPGSPRDRGQRPESTPAPPAGPAPAPSSIARPPVSPPSSSAPPSPGRAPSSAAPPSSGRAPSPSAPPSSVRSPSSGPPAASEGRSATERPATRALPGQPANRLSPGRGDARGHEQPGRASGAHASPPPASGKDRDQR
jgi:hypothetical protein